MPAEFTATPVGNDPTVTVALGASGVAVNPAGTRVYVTSNSANNVSVIDTGSNTVVATVAVGGGPQGVAVNPTGTRAYVANSGPNTVSVIDTATNTVIATVSAGGTTPIGTTVTPDGTRLYVVNRDSNAVAVIDTSTNTVVATVAVGTAPIALGLFIGGAAAPPSPPTITNGPPPNGTVGVTYNFAYTSTGAPTFSVTAGGLPPGLSLNAAGVINGIPTAVGTFTGTVTATNGTAPDATQNFSITIVTAGPPPGPTATIPTMSEWGIVVLSLLMAGVARLTFRRKSLS